jgi:hypothetical protein
VRWRPSTGPTASDGHEIPEVEGGEWSPHIELDRYDAVRVTAVIDPTLDAAQRDVSGTVIQASAPVSVFGGTWLYPPSDYKPHEQAHETPGPAPAAPMDVTRWMPALLMVACSQY